MEVGRTWVKNFLILEEGDITTVSVSKNHSFLLSNKRSKNNLFKIMLENDPTKLIMFDNTVFFSIDIKVCLHPFCHGVIRETCTIKELENALK